MAASQRKSFSAILEPDGTALNWVIARVPFDVEKAWPVRRRMRVRGEIEGFAFRTSLFPDPRSSEQVPLVNKKMQSAARAGPGARVRIWLEPDLEERPAIVPAELARELKGDRRLQGWFNALSESTRREIGKWVDDAKAPEVRRKRAERMAERLMLAMEGEDDPPPVLRAAFLRQPAARERRAAKALDDALRAARKLSEGSGKLNSRRPV